jgi:hypothetical protein
MSLPAKQILTLPEAASLWGTTIEDLGWHAVDGTLTLSMVLADAVAEIGEDVEVAPGRRSRQPHGQRTLTGVHDVFGVDVLRAFRGGTAVVRRLKPSNPTGFAELKQPAEGVPVTIADLVIRSTECERLAATYDIARPAKAAASSAAPAGLSRRRAGARPTHDWDHIWAHICKRVYDEGRPETLNELVNDVLDYLAESGYPVPDPSTVRKRVAKFWREIGGK